MGDGDLNFNFLLHNCKLVFLEDVMLVVILIVILGVFLHSALGSNAIQVTQIGKFRFVASHSMWI